jgi:hypothetical protein
LETFQIPEERRRNKKDFLCCAAICDVIDSSSLLTAALLSPAKALSNTVPNQTYYGNLRPYKWAVSQSIHVELFTAFMNFKLNNTQHFI